MLVMLTHIELPYEACHVIVLKVFGQNLLGKSALVKNMEAGASLEGNGNRETLLQKNQQNAKNCLKAWIDIKY